jgi:hypothetical protein
VPNKGSENIAQMIHFPLKLFLGEKEFLLNSIAPESSEFQHILSSIKKEKKASICFFSSQPSFVFERIHTICDHFIPGVAEKIDILLRELVKNAEKENVTILARKAGIVKEGKSHAPLQIISRILNEHYFLENDPLPLLYHYPEIAIKILIFIEKNELHFRIENYGNIKEKDQEMIKKRSELGEGLAFFDLRQEFEMKDFANCQETIRNFFIYEYKDKLDFYWEKAFEESFEEYWEESPYFCLISGKIHSSFFPYFASAYGELRAALKKEEKHEEEHFPAGLGYIQCAFVIEANRNLYGTYGKILVPENRKEKTVSGFTIGLSTIEVEI